MAHFIFRLVVQRTKLIDETQEILLELLEEMTTGRCHQIGHTVISPCHKGSLKKRKPSAVLIIKITMTVTMTAA